jgi:hypothetical protein
MNIECPSCKEDNKIEFAKNIICHKCKKSFAGQSYKKFKKPFISATTALIIGAYGTYKADKMLFEDQRYPLKVEYELVDSCINSSRTSLNYSQQVDKTKVCVCALEKTVEKISYKEMIESESEFLTRFRLNIASCY